MTTELLSAILDGGLRHPHFFEGRILTATDLSVEREAHRARQRRLGRALGSGIVSGLEVTIRDRGAGGTVPVLGITAGLALAADGDSLELAADIDLCLARELEHEPPPDSPFHACAPPSTKPVAVGEGVYLLLLGPAAGFRERAVMSGLGDPKAGAGCGSRWALEGVSFRLLPYDPLAEELLPATHRDQLADLLTDAATPARRSRLRNHLAHLFLASAAQAAVADDPLAALAGETPTNPIAGLRQRGEIADCEVPVALVHWTLSGLHFADPWAVRRRPVPSLQHAAAPMLSGDAFRADAEARVLQFQQHLAELLDEAAAPTSLVAREHFRFLPAAGLLPVAGSDRPRGLSVPAFFADRTVRGPLFTEGARVAPLFDRSYAFPAIDTESDEMVWLYSIRENRQRVPERPAVIFTSGFMPLFGDARYDINRWSFGNFSSFLV
ncbi:MAG: hypothetical protein AAF604_16180 [Acidobacteriota bacterium]